jgi:hypothetical protein
MQNLPTDVLFLLLASCPPPAYVNLALALCRRLANVSTNRRQLLMNEKRDEWRQYLYHQRVIGWQQVFEENYGRLPVGWAKFLITRYAEALARCGVNPTHDLEPAEIVTILKSKMPNFDEWSAQVQKMNISFL